MNLQPILVVDDEKEMRAAMCTALKRSGYPVDSVGSGVAALERVKTDNVGMVITDMKMPEMSGMEVLSGVKQISPQVPVIMVTAYGTVDNAVSAIQKGAADYILKPFSIDTLTATVKRAYKNTVSLEGHHHSASKEDCRFKEREIITTDPKMLQLLQLAKRIAPSKATILILGESGTGKELLASYIHRHSGLTGQPYVTMNCAALPESLAESELFGHEKGAFTGAATIRKGKFELANGGTILLDEISEMSIQLQAKLLRVLQEKEIDRVGGSAPYPVDTRVIAISNIDLQQAVFEGKFREDLYYRINVIPLKMQPLRERKCDIVPLAGYFLKKYGKIYEKTIKHIDEKTKSLLIEHEWKGNVRELKNTMERSVLTGSGEVLLPEHLQLEDSGSKGVTRISLPSGISVREMEKELIVKTLDEVKGNRTQAAEILGISIRTLRNKINSYLE